MDHSLKVGSLARAIARSEEEDEHSEFLARTYTAALLHDVGKLLLAWLDEDKYETVVIAVSRGVPANEQEAAVFDTDHAQVAAILLGLWGMPESIVDAVAFHHRPRQSSHAAFTPLVAVHAANALFYEVGGDRTVSHARRLDEGFMQAIRLSDRLRRWRSDCESILLSKDVDRTF
jgi:putative nucleotidyltransferase with HDIG domain